MKYVYIFQKDVATVMVWDRNNPFEWRVMYGGEILFDFDRQKAFIAGDEATLNGHRRWQAGGGFMRKFNVFSQKTSSMCQKIRLWHPICKERMMWRK